jgi:hypothetical protein
MDPETGAALPDNVTKAKVLTQHRSGLDIIGNVMVSRTSPCILRMAEHI